MKRALYFYHAKTSFTEIDRKALESEYQVIESPFPIKNIFSIPYLWLLQIHFLFKNISKSQVVLCMFGGYHSVLPVLFSKLFNKKCIIVAGGIDCVSFPSIGYGNFNKRFLGYLTCWSFRNCTLIAPISEYLVYSKYTYQPHDFNHQGIKYFCPGIKTPIKVIYNGFEIEKWYRTNEVRNKKSFLTIASFLDDDIRKKIKGVDLLLEVVNDFPDCVFTIVGINKLNNLPANVKTISPLPHDELRKIYCNHQFYLQLSMSEGFGNTLAESMLCECVPIGSNAGAIPMIIENAGYIVKTKNKENLKEVITQALIDKELESKGHLARKRIIDNFSFIIRKKELLRAFNS